MSNTDENIFSSTPFKFIIEGKSFYIHTALVSKYSKPLDRMMNGSMEEAQKGFAILEDVDEGTFARFSRWVYSGHYKAAEFGVAESRTESPLSSVMEGQIRSCSPITVEREKESQPVWNFSEMNFDAVLPPTGKKGKKAKKASFYHKEEDDIEMIKEDQELLKESFIRLQFPIAKAHSVAIPPRANQEPFENYTELFLSHARVYVFAEKYIIKPLKMLALRELHQTLAIYTLYPERVNDVVALLKYAYANTSEEQDNIEEDLRPLLTQYIGYEMDILVRTREFKELLEEGGGLLGDFLKMVAKRF